MPAFAHIKNKVLTHCANGLNPLPGSWHSMKKMGSSKDESRSTHGQANAVGGPNFSADEGLTSRFTSSGHTALLEDHDITVPNQGNKEVCLTWALKGQCGHHCKHGAMHMAHTPSAISKIHRLLTACGVTNNPQEE